MRRLSWMLWLLFALTGCASRTEKSTASLAPAGTLAPAALGTPRWDPDRMQPPNVPADPRQADLGAVDYYLICMACHGDRGQGLTEEWRMAWGEDYNCWKSKCHAANHPPEGFDLPRTSPPVFGLGSLTSYATAADLYAKVHETMPWWNPGALSAAQAWNLTAYLLRSRGELPDEMELTTATAGVVRLHARVAPRGPERSLAILAAGGLLLGALALAGGRFLR